ncbi:putative membrane protein [Duganella sp. SG902]|uniref:NnrU family protein n=1 Tax=Duganella sp. SG902 TaxID=2587016 RepID=UPI00159E9F3E|nr:NnrU family protein [Duganella sp. SG902]NVM74321.1 putative membrane protein [Duganella sp. SG902]
MTILILGLIIFLGLHSVRIVAEDWRNATRARIGENTWKGLYSVISIIGFVLIVWGYSVAREAPVVIWTPPPFTRHIAALLAVIAFVFLTAAYVPRNGIKAKLHHPMTLGVKTWALAHLIANGTLHDIVLFGAFLVWSVLLFSASRRRDRAAGTVYPAGSGGATALTITAGIVAAVVFAGWLHAPLIGVRPF